MTVLRHKSAVSILLNLALIPTEAFRILDVLNIISYGQSQLIRCKPLFHQLQGQRIRHLTYHDAGFLSTVWALEDLT